MTTWPDEITKDLEWREAEIGALKLLLASSSRNSDRQRALMRACCAMIYAHYEGFCKFCWTLMLSEIEKKSPERHALIPPLTHRAMAGAYQSLRKDLTDDNIWKFASITFLKELKERAIFPDAIDTKSNLWPCTAKEINKSVGIQCDIFDICDFQLRQLVGRRNEIAHGKKLEIVDVGQLQQLESAATLAMHGLAVAVVDCLEKETYVRQVQSISTVS